MAKVLSNVGIVTGLPVEAHHVSQSVNALTAAEAYDINISGSLIVNGITYPITDGTTGQVLTTDGAGIATFQSLTADTASYVSSSNVDGPLGMDSVQSASYAVSSSRSEFATQASSSIFAINAQSAVLADTASLALTSSYITASNVDGPFGMNSILSASYALTASFATNAEGVDEAVYTSSITGITQSFTLGNGTTYENYILSSSYSNTSSFALTASYITSSGVDGPLGMDSVLSSSYALTASFIEMADAYRQDFSASVVAVNHNFGTDDILVQVYRVDTGSGFLPVQILPDEILLTNDNTARITFSQIEAGYVIVSDGGGIVSLADSASYATTASYALNADGVDQAVYTSSISGFTQSFTLGSGATYENYIQSASYAVTASYVELNLTENFRGEFVNVTTFTATHAFDTEDILIQVYESSSIVTPPRQIVPSTVTLDNLNQATVTFAGPTTGFIVINKNSGYISSGSTQYAQTASYVNATQRNLQDGEGIIDFYFDGSTDALVTLDTASARFLNSTVLSSSFSTTASFAQTASHAQSSSYAVTASYITGYIESASYAGRAEKTPNVQLPIFNDDSVVINFGDPVAVQEFDGTSYRVRLADALDPDRMPAIGLSLDTLNVGEVGEVLLVGEIKGLNTFGLQEGRNIYVASGSGWTQTIPAGPAQTQPLGIIAEESAIAGRLIINGPVADIAIGGGMATTASYISSSNVDGPLGMDSILTASYAVTASYIELAAPIKADFVNQVTFVVTHGFDTENLNIDVYEDSAATGNIPTQIQPSSIRQINLNQVEVNFAAPTTGFVVVSKGGFLRLGTVEQAQSASYANRVPNNLINGKGIETLAYDGSSIEAVILNTASAHFLNSTVLSSSFATSASYSQTASYVAGKVETASFAEFAAESKFTEDVRLPIINDDTSSISKGDPVFVEEHDGLNYRVRLADASNAAKMPAIGVSMTDLAVGDSGSVLIAGDIEGLNTFNLIAGRNIYVAPGGGYTQDIPTGSDQTQPLGVVAEESPTLGRLIINGPLADIATGDLADTASYISSSNVDGPFGFDSVQTASYALTASYIDLDQIFSDRFDFVNQTVVNFTHTLNSDNVIIQAYETTGATSTQIIPTSVVINSSNLATVTFAAPTTGYVVATRGGVVQAGVVQTAITASYIDNTYKQDVAGGLTYAITHNLNEEFPIVQAYDIVTRAQELPASIVSAGPQSVTVTFAVIFNGTIIVKK